MKVRSTNEDATAMAQAALGPGERLLGVCDFINRSGGMRMPVTLSVSTSMFRIGAFRESGKGRRYKSTDMQPLSNVAGVSDRVIRALGAADTHVLVVNATNGYSYRFECNYIDASDFIETLKAALAAPALAGSIADELERLAKLADDGLLEPDEWDRAKALYLGSPDNARLQTVQMLRDLYAMMKAGVLSESEFRQKKWDILSRPT
jgi:hypothetical protein